MSVITRLTEIVAANVNALLDRAENPEWLAGQIVRDMEAGLDTARRLAATAIAHDHHLGRDLEHNRNRAEFWKTKAREALAANREDLARQVLAHKHGYDELVRILTEGGYEADASIIYYGLPTRFAPGIEDTLVTKVLELVQRTGGTVPPPAKK